MESDVNQEGPRGVLYIVSTPIGNMGDFSFRAVETLKSVSLILAEDTRHTRNLLDRYEIKTRVTSYHEHNEAKTTPALVQRLRRGESLALVSDAGTPLLSDPGSRLVRAAIDAAIDVVAIPGASALLSALVASGFDMERFTFFGFLTRTGSDRRSALNEITKTPHTVVLYEAPNRVAATLGELEDLGNGQRPAAVAREMTKQFEEVRRGTVGGLRAYYEDNPARGEIVLVIGPALIQAPSNELVRERVQSLREAGMSARDVAALVAEELGVPKRVAYQLAQAMKSREVAE
jgi:16S rRNA (cytidine1402-2'-O)-methyltransferase